MATAHHYLIRSLNFSHQHELYIDANVQRGWLCSSVLILPPDIFGACHISWLKQVSCWRHQPDHMRVGAKVLPVAADATVAPGTLRVVSCCCCCSAAEAAGLGGLVQPHPRRRAGGCLQVGGPP